MVGVPPARRIRGPHRPAAASATLPPTTRRRDRSIASRDERSAACGLFTICSSSRSLLPASAADGASLSRPLYDICVPRYGRLDSFVKLALGGGSRRVRPRPAPQSDRETRFQIDSRVRGLHEFPSPAPENRRAGGPRLGGSAGSRGTPAPKPSPALPAHTSACHGRQVS